MSGQLDALKQVAALDAKILDLEAEARKIPEKLRKREEELERSRLILTAKQNELKDLKAKTSIKEKELQEAEQAVIKLRQQINQARSNKEFQALQHEILSKEADNARIEEAVLQQLQKVDRQAEECEALAKNLKKAEAAATQERTHLEKERERIQRDADKLRAERNLAGKNVNSDIFAKYERLIARRGQTAMVAVIDETCQGCFMKLRPETMAQLRKAADLVTCHSCGRILYLEGEQ